jgi:cytochrome c
MKHPVIVVLAAAFATTPVWADLALAQKNSCMACHTVDRKVVGPAYKDVARKYAGKDVTTKLASKIIKGGTGTWGVIPMPANPKVSQEDAETLVKWVLSLK